MISEGLHLFLSLDAPALIATICVSVACALLGNFLVLRRISLMGDAVSHAVLPGIVFGFLISDSRAGLPMFIGAALAGIACALLIEFVKKLGKVETGAAMGVVFSIFFAGGVLLMEQAAAGSIDLDADCVLHGQLELIFWSPPTEWSKLFSLAVLSEIPREIPVSIASLLVVMFCISLFYKELKITAFDPSHATSLGFNSQYVHYGYMILVAVAIVAAFQIVGSILVIAMIICPAASARLLTDRLNRQLLLSAVIAILSSLIGYFIAGFGPMYFGGTNSLNAAGMITVVLGLFFAASFIFAPRYGLIAQKIRNFLLGVRVGAEDILGSLYRLEETSGEDAITTPQALAIAGSGFRGNSALRQVVDNRYVNQSGEKISLTEAGRDIARKLVRSHRLWEAYLEKYVGLPATHVHPTAEELEHFTSKELIEKLAEEAEHPDKDPHGSKIPD